MNIDAFKKLSAHLRTLPPEKWDYSTVVNNCGTCGCAIYAMCDVDPKVFKLGLNSHNEQMVIMYNDPSILSPQNKQLMAYFDVSCATIHKVFYSSFSYDTCDHRNVTACMVADKIDELIANYESTK